MTRTQAAKTIIETNNRFNILEFDPEHLGLNSFESDAVKMSRAYHRKIKTYVNYLLYRHRGDWENKIERIYAFLFEQLGTKSERFDGFPESVLADQTWESLSTIMTNLAYLWVVHHGETFSLVSVASNFYLVPPMMRKPLSALKTGE